MDLTYGRIRDLGGLPEALRSIAGDAGVAQVFKHRDIPVKLLDSPDTLVPMRDLVAIYHRASEVTANQSFGLEASRLTTIANRGLFGAYIAQAPTLYDACVRASRVSPHFESGCELSVELRNDQFVVIYRNAYQGLNGWHHMGAFKFAMLGNLVTAFVGKNWRPERIETCFSEKQYGSALEDFFDAPVLSERDRMAVFLPRELACVPRPAVSPFKELVSFNDVIRLGRALPKNFVEVVANMIERRLITGRSDFEGTASALGIGPRTIQRRLSEHGLTYRKLLLKIRMRRARDLLAEPDILVNQIGQECGYASAPQFTRAFKTEFGITPQAYRQSVC